MAAARGRSAPGRHPLVELGRALEVGEQEGEAGDLEALVDVDRVGAVEVAERLVGEQPLGVRNGLRFPIMLSSVSPPPQTPGSTRVSVRFSSARRSGPGRSSMVPVGACSLLVDQRQVCRSRVGSPFGRMTARHASPASKTMMNWAGSCSDRIGLLARRQLDRVERDLIEQLFERVSAGRTPEPQNIWRQYSGATTHADCGGDRGRVGSR